MLFYFISSDLLTTGQSLAEGLKKRRPKATAADQQATMPPHFTANKGPLIDCEFGNRPGPWALGLWPDGLILDSGLNRIMMDDRWITGDRSCPTGLSFTGLNFSPSWKIDWATRSFFLFYLLTGDIFGLPEETNNSFFPHTHTHTHTHFLNFDWCLNKRRPRQVQMKFHLAVDTN